MSVISPATPKRLSILGSCRARPAERPTLCVASRADTAAKRVERRTLMSSDNADIVIVRRDDLGALANVVALAIARGQVGENDAAVHDAFARAKEVLGARP
jgi:hypothetical protein